MLFGKYINKYYKKYGIFLFIGIIFLVAVDWIQLYIPEFTGKIIDYIKNGFPLTEDATNSVCLLILYIVLVGIGMFVGRLSWRFAILFSSARIEADLRKEMFEKAERLSVQYFHDTKVGTIMAWFTTDLEAIQECFGWGTCMLVDGVFLLILTLIKMFQLDWALSLIAIIPIVLIVVWGALVEKVMSEKWALRQKSYDELYDFSQENFTGIRVIKAFVKENKEIFAFSKLARKNAKVEIDHVKVSVKFDVFIELIIAFIFTIILAFGGWFVFSAATGNPIVLFGKTITLTPGELVTYIGYFDTIIWPLIALGQLITMISKGKTSLGRVSNYLDTPEEIFDRDGAISMNVKGKVTFNHFFFKYPSSNEDSLTDVCLTIEAGESVGIVGKIGCGKSTLANSLLRLYNVSPRSILIDDVDIMDIKVSSLRDNVALVPQDNFLFSDTIKNNIKFSDDTILDSRVEQAAEFADVAENINDFKNKYETITGERGVTLSGGQKQRISIARAYAKESPIMILDDSVSAVDLKTEEKILKNIAEQRKGKTTIVVASRVSTVSHLDKIIVLNEGKVEAFDTPKNLLKTSPTYQKMVYLQKLEKEVNDR